MKKASKPRTPRKSASDWLHSIDEIISAVDITNGNKQEKGAPESAPNESAQPGGFMVVQTACTKMGYVDASQSIKQFVESNPNVFVVNVQMSSMPAPNGALDMVMMTILFAYDTSENLDLSAVTPAQTH